MVARFRYDLLLLILFFGASTTIVAQQATPPANNPVVPTGSVSGASNLNSRSPFRVQFGSLARQTGGNANLSGGLPAPNSPYRGSGSAPAGQSNGQSAEQTSSTSSLPLPNSVITPPRTTTGGSEPANQNSQNQRGPVGTQFTTPADQPIPRGAITRVTKRMDRLPNDAGQVWREYDISPYTSKITSIPDPQQAILDWILKETGTEMWFNQPLGILNADKNQLRVYHTPEIQSRVHRIVDRFVNTQGQIQNVEVSLVTVGRPNWRSDAYTVLQPIEVQSPGVEAWMVSKENAALLRATLSRRGDFEDHGTGRLSTHDGQSVVLRNTQPIQFMQNFRWTANQLAPYQPLMTTVQEGYTLEISSLSSLTGDTIEATIECHVDQVEKLNTVKVDVPSTVGATTDKLNLQIPQLVSWRLKERFRWRNDQVLLLSCGVVATPTPREQFNVNLPSFLGGNRQRADALLFIDYRGPDLGSNAPIAAQNRTVPIQPRR